MFFLSFVQAISSLLKDELDKVAAGAESERRGAMLKKFKRVERRSGGLCNPDLLEKVLRSSSSDAGGSSPRVSASNPSPLPPPHSDPKGLGTTATPASNLVVVDDDPEATAAAAAAGASAATQDTPWAEDMLCRGVRKRHAAMLRTRGRALAKGLARMLKGVSTELKGVSTRLPPWEEEEGQEDDPAAQEEEVSRQGGREGGSPLHWGHPPHAEISVRGWPVGVLFRVLHLLCDQGWGIRRNRAVWTVTLIGVFGRGFVL